MDKSNPQQRLKIIIKIKVDEQIINLKKFCVLFCVIIILINEKRRGIVQMEIRRMPEKFRGSECSVQRLNFKY